MDKDLNQAELNLKLKKLHILKFGAYVKASDLEAQIEFAQIEDKSSWINNASKWLDEAEITIKKSKLSSENHELILSPLRAARKSLGSKDILLAHRFIREIKERWHYAMHNKGLPGVISMDEGRRKAGKARKEQLIDQANKTSNEVLDLYRALKIPERNRAAVIAKKVGITSARVRQILRNAKKRK